MMLRTISKSTFILTSIRSCKKKSNSKRPPRPLKRPPICRSVWRSWMLRKLLASKWQAPGRSTQPRTMSSYKTCSLNMLKTETMALRLCQRSILTWLAPRLWSTGRAFKAKRIKIILRQILTPLGRNSRSMERKPLMSPMLTILSKPYEDRFIQLLSFTS